MQLFSSASRWGRLALVLLGLLWLSNATGAQEDWPQWRGVDGMAWSKGGTLPAEIGPDSPALAWRAKVPGSGISSPVVEGGRVFVTTAYEGEVGGDTAAIQLGVPVLAVFAVLLALGFRRRNAEEKHFLGDLDATLVLLGTIAFVGAALVVLFQPERLYEDGAPGYRWFFTGAIALVGVAVGFGWFRPASFVRVLGIAVVLLLAWQLHENIPTNKYNEEFGAKIKLGMILPGLGIAGWYLLSFLIARKAPERGNFAVNVLGLVTLLFVASGMFVLENVLAPAAGLVRAVVCYDLETGQELWNTPLFVAVEERKYDKNSFATPTPCANGDVVFADFGSGYACLDYEGSVRWLTVNEDYAEHTRYGAAASPVLYEDTVILLHDAESGAGPSYVMGVALDDGAVRWRNEETDPDAKNVDSYTTPLLVTRDGETQLVTAGFKRIIGYDPRTGEELWSHATRIGQMVPSIQYRGDLLLVAGGTHGDVDTLGLRMSGKGSEVKLEKLWSTRRMTPNISSPVWIEDVFIGVTDGGRITCYDPPTGDVHWQERLFGAFWASLAAGDGKVYAINDEGVMYTLRAGTTFEVLHEGDFDSPCLASPSIAGNRVLVRTADELFCFLGS